MATKNSSKTAVYGALVGNVLVAATKLGAALWTGSASMMSEAIHSFVDTGNEVLLLYGQHRAKKPADRTHPLGYGREIYFWSFVVALLIFALGAGISIYEGIIHIRHPEPMQRPLINYAVYGISALFEGISWWFGWKAFSGIMGSRGIFDTVKVTKDPTTFIVLFEDSAALIGIAIATAATFLALRFGKPWIDGVGSICIGMVLAAVAVLLARESKALLIGERARPELSQAIEDIVRKAPGVIRVEGILTSQLGPDQVIATIGVELDDNLRTPDIEQLIGRLENELRERHPDLFRVFVRPHPKQYQGDTHLLDLKPDGH